MPTFYHAPRSRSSAIAVLIDEMGIADKIDIRVVDVPRLDGTGRRDPANPHPEGKVPALVHDGVTITERGAIILHLLNLFPDSGLSPRPGTAAHGALLTWLVWYGSVFEPVIVHQHTQLQHPVLSLTYRTHVEAAARIRAALEKGPWLLGPDYSAADLLVHSPYAFFTELMPDDALIRDWVARCQARPAIDRVRAADTARLAA